MKRGFTLVEMLIVVVVLVTLMTITFKLSSIGSGQWAKNTTISRMQRLENCVSGYYAAFGSYPPVHLHGSRNYGYEVDVHGIQKIGDSEPSDDIWGLDEDEAWKQVKAACRSQPVACEYPSSGSFAKYLTALSAKYQKLMQLGKYDDLSEEKRNIISAGFTSTEDVKGSLLPGKESDWTKSQIYKFGLMSYLLPRYLLMIAADKRFLTHPQWLDNNKLPSNPYTGIRYGGWEDIRRAVVENGDRGVAEVRAIASQSVCARWMPNLADACATVRDFNVFGVKIKADTDGAGTIVDSLWEHVYSPAGNDQTSQQYANESITMVDGWGEDFYYYSPTPNQTYTIWSSGANKRTFPPWVDRSGDFGGKSKEARSRIAKWTADDLIHMSN